jgi:excisionase family DNA binding protein
MTNQRALSVKEVADELKLTPQTIRDWIRAGVLPAVKVSHVFRVNREDVDAMLLRHREETTSLGIHRDLWAPETLGSPFRRHDATVRPSIWDGTDSPALSPKRS